MIKDKSNFKSPGNSNGRAMYVMCQGRSIPAIISYSAVVPLPKCAFGGSYPFIICISDNI